MSEVLVNSPVVAGWFGKIPGLGDFASRRLPESFVSDWDAWLQGGMHCAREAHGEAWLEGYLVAPIWRFWLAPGVLGQPAWAGLLMPSIDRVGRHFPLTLAQPAQSLASALESVDWYRALDQAARRVLDLNFAVDDFEQALREIAAPGTASASAPAQTLAERLLAAMEAATPGSVWWCGDAGEATRFLCVPALPAPALLASMWNCPP